jgi:excinuclease ABC subunit C
MESEAIRERAASLPRDPGVYQFLDDGTTLYVGKAVDLRNRVRSYADATPGASGAVESGPRSERIREMVVRSDAVEVSVTETETQALLLEANLIKRHQPRYNVRLKDDKSYPLVQLTDHEFPRIEVTRDPEEGATVFGPFTDKGRVEAVVKALRETYGVRGCSDHKFANRDRPCLDHDIGLCTAPCVEETAVTREQYLADAEAVRRYLGGETDLLVDPLEAEMERAAQEQAFERAANLRDLRDAAQSLHGGEADVVREEGERAAVDVLGAAVEGREATVARLHSDGGQLVDRTRHTLAAPEVDDAGDPVAAVLGAFVAQFYAERPLPSAVLLPVRPDDEELRDWLDAEGVDLRVPGAGREARLVDLALKNARRGGGDRDGGAALAAELGLDRVERIEGFDVSHAQGRAVVGSDVTFVGGAPEKADYRRRKLPEGNDDYANVRRLVAWRAERALAGRDDRPDPDLLLVDGGEGQLAAARAALAEAGWSVPVVALAKDEEVVHAASGDPADHGGSATTAHDWPDDAAQLHLLQRVRDEAHRFAVQYHQTRRDSVDTALDDVAGVGPETRRRLLRRFGSVEGVRVASEAELRSVEGVGEATATAIAESL